MSKPDQKYITQQQVLSRMNEAGNRSTRQLDKALAATDAEDYQTHLDAAIKAAEDFKVWKTVYDAIAS
jgi:hypothetical protein